MKVKRILSLLGYIRIYFPSAEFIRTSIDGTWPKCNSNVKENKESERVKVQNLCPEMSCRESD